MRIEWEEEREFPGDYCYDGVNHHRYVSASVYWGGIGTPPDKCHWHAMIDSERDGNIANGEGDVDTTEEAKQAVVGWFKAQGLEIGP